MENARDELREAIESLGERGRGRAYPKGLLEKLLSYTVARRRQGATLIAVGDELGMKWQTLARWIGERKTAPRFERVQVAAATPSERSAVVVHGPRGLRIEGLDIDGVAALVRRLGE